jgi:signal transduction histidine kinase
MDTLGRWATSLRFRLLAATLAALALALLLAGLFLGGLFREHVLRQFQTTLTQQLDQLTARLEFDAAGQPLIDPLALSDPRWQKPYSGLYWQIDSVSAVQGSPEQTRTAAREGEGTSMGTSGQARSGVLRSRSLWDDSLTLATDPLDNGTVHVHEGSGPQGARLLILERTVRTAEQPDAPWRLIVAGDLQDTTLAVDRFTGMLAVSLAVLGALLVLAALAQVAVGLSPLRKLQRALVDVHEGHTQRLQGRFPTEVQPLIDGFNGVLDRNTEVVNRARTQAGNLAHALKTPLAVLGQAAASDAPPGELARLVQEQVALSRRHIDWHLAHARAAASQRLPGQRTPVAPVVGGLLRVMSRVHAERGLHLSSGEWPADWAFAGEEQDLQEMLGNLLDNACLWARCRVHVDASRSGGQLVITLEDDGPGIAAEQRSAVLARGVRLDESTPGSGLGLAIVVELATLYGGALRLGASETGGLSARLSLPAAA